MGRTAAPLLPSIIPEGVAPLAWCYPHTKGGFQVRVHGTYLGYFLPDRYNDIWECLKKHQRVSAGEEETTQPPELSPRERRSLCQHARAMDIAFGNLLQGDVTAAVECEVLHRPMHVMEPALELASIQGKIRPWKEALWNSWRALGAPKSPGVLEKRAELVGTVLIDALRRMPGSGFEIWVKHCCKNNAYHSGFLALALRLGLVTTVKQKTPGPDREWLHLSVDPSTSYQVASGVLESKVTLRTLIKFVNAADVLQEVTHCAPRTCQDWIDNYELLKKQLRQKKDVISCNPSPNSYLCPWTYRAYCLVRMKA